MTQTAPGVPRAGRAPGGPVGHRSSEQYTPGQHTLGQSTDGQHATSDAGLFHEHRAGAGQRGVARHLDTAHDDARYAAGSATGNPLAVGTGRPTLDGPGYRVASVPQNTSAAPSPAAPSPANPSPRNPSPKNPKFNTAASRRRAWSADIAGCAAAATMLFVIGLWLAGGEIHELSLAGGIATSTGRLTGMLAADLLLLQVLLMARIPIAERAWGQDTLTRWHRLVGISSFFLMVAHILLITLGYAQAAGENVLAQAWDLTVNYPGMLIAVAGTVCLIAVAATSMRAARRRMRYESWHLLHLYAYAGVGLALPHQLWTGADFLDSPVATVFWWAMWGAAAAAIIVFRIALPLGRSLFHGLRIVSVEPETRGVVSVVMRGRHLDRLSLKAGQYFQWRFLAGAGWTRAHPYSVSGMPTGDLMRLAARINGDDGARVAALKPGTRVAIEGPYGGLTADRRGRRDVLLVAAGVGITPIRALAQEIAAEPPAAGPGGVRRPSVVLLHRIGSAAGDFFGDELSALASLDTVRAVRICGPRAADGSWLPAGERAKPDDVLRRVVPDVATREAYLCGPPGWTAAVAKTLRRVGVPAGAIHSERFDR